MPLPPGTKLGPYEILAPIGAGGMGEVYKARDPRLNRIVAIKRLKGQHTARFEQEAHAIAALNHPNICQIHDIGRDYLVMEYVEGKPISGSLRVEEALKLAVQIASAMEEAHSKGILHRDLKPANILVTVKGSAKLLDFGLAKLMTEAHSDATETIEGTILGTAAYMAPEQAEGKPLDERSDIFSFGAVLYEMLSGNRAFLGNSTATVLSAVLRDDPAPLQAPAELQRIVVKCLAKQPGNRFQRMEELRAALERVSGKPVDPRPSIAVLPFANMSGDKEQDYFTDGMAEEVINALAQVQGLKVIARTSAFAFKGKNEDVRKIAEQLGVTNVLEGSVRRAGNRLRITAQLIHAADGTHLWSQRYDRDMTDIFAVQDEISQAISEALQLKLAPALVPRRMPTLPAYEAYLKYRHYQWRFTPEASRRSRECLEQALALDPGFALPYVGLADHYLALASVGGMPAREAMPQARDLARRALELDPDLPEAHAMLGIVAGHYELDWREAERRFRLAMAREPISCHLRLWYALFFLFSIGRAEEARWEIELVLKEDPLSQMWHWALSEVLRGIGRNDEALSAGRKAVEIDPQFWAGWMWLGLLQAIQGRTGESRNCAEKATAGAPWSPYCIGLMAGVLTNTGETEKAEELLANLRRDAYGGPAGLANYHLVLGEFDHALEWAGKAVEQRFPTIIIMLMRAYAPLFRELAGWSALLKKMGMPELL
jgi:TolB-like protein/tRNA A-37 threonylcarbamoyl transferase component Bud32